MCSSVGRGGRVGADAVLIDRLVARQLGVNATECAQVIDMLFFVADARSRGEQFAGERAGKLEAEAALHELSLALKVPVGSLQGALAAARLARTKLPSVWEAWEAGVIGAAHVGLIVGTAHRLKRAGSINRLDNEVVAIGKDRTVTQLRRWLARFVDRVEPDMCDKRHREACRERRVYVEVGEDGMSWLSALLPSAEAAAIDTLVEAAARVMANTDQYGDDRTHDQKRADAFSDVLLGVSAEDSGRAGARVDIGVVVPIQSLLGLSDAPGETIDRSASVPASYLRSLALREGTLFWRLLTDERGNLLDVVRIGRFATGDLGMALRFRDGTSVFPTSTVPANDCDYDHTEDYPAPTTATNLGALHRRAHRLKTEGLLSVRQTRPGTFTWDTSTGHTYTRKPEPLPTTGWDHEPWFDPGLTRAIAMEIETGEINRGYKSSALAA